MTTASAVVFTDNLAGDGNGSRPSVGDCAAFGAMLIDRSRTLRAYANMLTGNRAAADDLLQDTFERALRGAAQFRAGSNLTAWLRRIMRNLFTDRCRQGTRFLSMSDANLADRLADEATAEPRDLEESDLLREFLTTADVKAALTTIDQPLRDIFVRAHLKRQSYQTIAVSLGIPVSTVGTRLWRARARLRTALVKAGRTTGGRTAGPPAAPARVS
jgi:RNA polymerase sigma-70 factor, ECF subfamily